MLVSPVIAFPSSGSAQIIFHVLRIRENLDPRDAGPRATFTNPLQYPDAREQFHSIVATLVATEIENLLVLAI